MKPFEPIQNLFQVIHSFIFWQFSLLFWVLFQVPAITELSDDESIITRTEWVNKLDNILVLDLFKDLNLWFEKLLKFRHLFHLFFAKNFNGHDIVSFGIDCFVDSPIWAASQFRE